MNCEQPVITYRRDYKPSDFIIPEIFLAVDLDDTDTRIESSMHIVRQESSPASSPLVLDGNHLELENIFINGTLLDPSEYDKNELCLIIKKPPSDFELKIVTRLNPSGNKALEGLYKSGSVFCTQCEPQGFRRITYFIDRPDIMSRYSVRITADRKQCPVLLSNGNLRDKGRLKKGRHWTLWEDPFPKPGYLFALVAGKPGMIRDSFKTRSGRRISLRIFCDPGNEVRCFHAMESLKKAMKWDEERFGLECDLDDYSVVAVDSFNAGAMENKGLNIFNSHYVLADPETATDSDFENIEAVIGHEYFHNWTGNRVTCRDWFQLTLKEGLTVFRDQEFTSDLHSRAVKRIEDARHLRAVQFVEDAGPMSHPIRPESYLEISNFYTSTVYEKGAEVIRMIHTLLGEDLFQKGMKRYIELFDGQAVTCEDFIRSMEEAGGCDLSVFRLWYQQSGTPVIRISDSYNKDKQELHVKLEQSLPETPGKTGNNSMHIPLALGCLDSNGNDMALTSAGDKTVILNLKEKNAHFVFNNIIEKPVLSVNRGFSAPVRIETGHSLEDLLFLFANDNDPFSAWDAGQTVCRHYLKSIIEDITSGKQVSISQDFIDGYGRILGNDSIDAAFRSLMLELPQESVIAQDYNPVDFNAIHHARNIIRKTLGLVFQDDFTGLYQRSMSRKSYSYNAADCGKRSLSGLCLSYLCETADGTALDLCYNHFKKSDNMTDVSNSLWALNNTSTWHREQAMDEFYHRWKSNRLVMIKWLSLQSTSRVTGTPENIRHLEKNQVYDPSVPNLVRSLIGGFCTNYIHFHALDGSGYHFISEKIIELDQVNPHIASALAGSFRMFPRVNGKRKELMDNELRRIINHKGLSRNTFEVVIKTIDSVGKNEHAGAE